MCKEGGSKTLSSASLHTYKWSSCNKSVHFIFAVIPETVPDFFSGDENDSKDESRTEEEITSTAKPLTALEKLNAVLKDVETLETKRTPRKNKSLRTPQKRHSKSFVTDETGKDVSQMENKEKSNKKTPTKVSLKDKSLSTSSEDMSMTIDGPPSPVFGKAAPVSIGRRMSSAAEKSLESPSLFDDDDPMKSANDKSTGDTSFEGLNIRRRAHNRKSPKSVGHKNTVSSHAAVPSTSRASSLKSPAKSTASENRHQRQVLQEIENLDHLDDPDESTSPSVLSGKIKNFHHVGNLENRNQNSAINLCDSDEVIDLEKAMNDGESLSQRTRSQRRKKIEENSGASLEVSSPSSRVERGKKLVQSKIPKDYFKRKKTDLSTSMEFNGGKLNGSTNLTPEEQEALNIELAIQESLKEQEEKKSQGRSQGQDPDDEDSILERVIKKSLEETKVKGQPKGQGRAADLQKSPEGREVRDQHKGQSQGRDLHKSLEDTEVRGQIEGQSHPLDLDLHTEMTAPAFTSTPFVTNATKKKTTNFTRLNTLVDSQELFKKPGFLPKSPRTPKRKKSTTENDSPRRSPRLNKDSASKGRNGLNNDQFQGQVRSPRQGSRSRKQLNLSHNPDQSTDIDRDRTLPDLVPGLNGSVDPIVRLSEFDGDESHLVGKSGISRLMDKSGSSHLVGRSRSDLLERSDVSGTSLRGTQSESLVARSGNYEDSRSNIEQGIFFVSNHLFRRVF